MSREDQFARDLTSADETSEISLESGHKSGGGFGTFADLKGFQEMIARRKGAVSEQITPVDPSEVREPRIREARAQAIDRINAVSKMAEADLRAVIGENANPEVMSDLTVRESLIDLEDTKDIDAGWDVISVPVNTDSLDADWERKPANDGGAVIEPTPQASTDRRSMRGMFARGEEGILLPLPTDKQVGGSFDVTVDEPPSVNRRTLRADFGNMQVDEKVDLPKTLDMEPESLIKTMDMGSEPLTETLDMPEHDFDLARSSKATIIDISKGKVLQEEPIVKESGSTDTIPMEPVEGYEKPYVYSAEPIDASGEDEEPDQETLLGQSTLRGGFEVRESGIEDDVEQSNALKGLGSPQNVDIFSGVLKAGGVLALTKLLQKNGISEEDWNRFNPYDRERVEKIQNEMDAQQARIDQLKREKLEIKMATRSEIGYKAPLSKEVQIKMQEKDREIASVEALMLKNRNQQEMILQKPKSVEIAETLVDAQEEVKPGRIEEYLQEAPEPKSSWWKNSPRFRKVATGTGMLVGAGLIAGAWLGGKIFKTLFRPFKITEMLGNGVYNFFNFLERSIVKGDPIGALSDAVNGAGKFFDEKMKKAEDWVNKKPEKRS